MSQMLKLAHAPRKTWRNKQETHPLRAYLSVTASLSAMHASLSDMSLFDKSSSVKEQLTATPWHKRTQPLLLIPQLDSLSEHSRVFCRKAPPSAQAPVSKTRLHERSRAVSEKLVAMLEHSNEHPGK